MTRDLRSLQQMMRQPERALTAHELWERALVNALWCAIHGHDPEQVGLGASDDEWDGMCQRVRAALAKAGVTP